MSAGLPPQSVDVLWDNGGYDGRTGITSFRLQGFSGYDTWAADDFIVDASWHITSATAQFYVDLDGRPPFEIADIGIWVEPSPGAKPGRTVVELKDLPIEWEQIGEGYGLPIISARVKGLDIQLKAPGAYYFSMRLVSSWDYGHGGMAYLCTTGNGKLRGRTGAWRWINHPPHWEPAWWSFSTKTWLSTSDFTFSVEGERE